MSRRFKIGGKKTLKKKTKRDRRKKRKTTRKKNKSRRKRNGGSISRKNIKENNGYEWSYGMKGYITRIDTDTTGDIKTIYLRVKYPDGFFDKQNYTYDVFNRLVNKRLLDDNATKVFIKEWVAGHAAQEEARAAERAAGRARMLRALQTGRVDDPHADAWGSSDSEDE